MVCPHGQKGSGLSQCGHFSDKGGGGQFFAILCGRLLWTAPCNSDVTIDFDLSKNNDQDLVLLNNISDTEYALNKFSNIALATNIPNALNSDFL